MTDLDPFDLGLEDVSKYPTCAACRKKSDGAKRVTDYQDDMLCGTHYDEWLTSPEHEGWRSGTIDTLGLAFASFVSRLRTTRYAACWKEEG